MTSQLNQTTDVAPIASSLHSDDVTMTSRVPLWVPYIVLTGVLLLLILISFMRFHILRDRERNQAADQPTAPGHRPATQRLVQGLQGVHDPGVGRRQTSMTSPPVLLPRQSSP